VAWGWLGGWDLSSSRGFDEAVCKVIRLVEIIDLGKHVSECQVVTLVRGAIRFTSFFNCKSSTSSQRELRMRDWLLYIGDTIKYSSQNRKWVVKGFSAIETRVLERYRRRPQSKQRGERLHSRQYMEEMVLCKMRWRLVGRRKRIRRSRCVHTKDL